MNASILVAAISVSFMVCARLLMGVLALAGGGASMGAVLIPVLVALLILWGVVKGHRLAWQWGRVLGLVGGILATLSAVGIFAKSGGQPASLLVGGLVALQGAPLFPMFFALGTHEARQYFRLVCPQCGRSRPRGGNFLYTRAMCRNCNVAWE